MRTSALEGKIRRRIKDLTNGRVQILQVAVDGRHVVVSGIAASYYLEQLAIRGVLESVGEKGSARIEVDIKVADGSKGRASADSAEPMSGYHSCRTLD